MMTDCCHGLLKSIIILMYCFCCYHLSAQDYGNLPPAFINYQKEDGLSSNENYGILQDTQGLIWIAGDRGIDVFDGKNFKHYGVKEGLSANVIIEMCLAPDGTLWASSAKGALFYLQGNRFVAYEVPGLKELLQYCDIYAMRVVAPYGLQLITNYGVVSIKDRKLDTTRFSQCSGVVIDHDYDPKLYRSFIRRPKQTTSKKLKYARRFIHKQAHIDTILVSPDNWLLPGAWGSLNDSTHFWRNYLVKHTPEGITAVHCFEEAIITGLEKDDYFLLGGFNTGLMYVDKTTQAIKKRYFKDVSVSKIICDRDGGIWFTTLSKGIYYLPNEHIKMIRSSLGAQKVLAYSPINDTSFYYTTNTGQLILYHLNTNEEQLIQQTSCVNTDLVFIPKKNLHLLLGYFTSMVKDREVTTISKSYSKRFFPKNDSVGMMLASKLLLEYSFGNDTEMGSVINKIIIPQFMTTLQYWEDDWYVGTAEGLLKMTREEPYELIPYKLPGQAIKQFKIINADHLIYTTANGVLFQRLAGQLTNLSEKFDLPSIHNDVQLINNQLWLASDQGLFVIDWEEEKLIDYFGESDGIPSGQVYRIYAEDDHLVLCTEKGILMVEDLNSLNKYRRPSLYTSLWLAGQEDPRTTAEIKKTDTLIQIKAQAIDFASNQFSRIMYQVNEGQWAELSNDFLNVSDFGYGHYHISFRLYDALNQVVDEKKITLHLKPPFHKSNQFYGLLALLIFSLILLLVILFMKRQRERQLQKVNLALRIDQLKDEVLRSKLNPHFVFNTLNSIQRLFLENKHELASDFLADFSDFFRLVLRFSSLSKITIREEMKLAAKYLLLEKMRLKEDLSYEIDNQLSPAEDKHMIPSLLLQPLIENAIWHGLMPVKRKNREGKLKLCIYLKAGFITIELSDNGKGINLGEDLEQDTIGMRITRNRLSEEDEFFIVSRPEFEGTKIIIKIKINP